MTSPAWFAGRRPRRLVHRRRRGDRRPGGDPRGRPALAEPAVRGRRPTTPGEVACLARIDGFREDTRGQRMRVADDAERLWGRKVSWGGVVRRGPTSTSRPRAVPVMTRLRMSERRVLDTLIDAGVARSRSEALAWCVRLVGKHQSEWIDQLREAMEHVERVRADGPDPDARRGRPGTEPSGAEPGRLLTSASRRLSRYLNVTGGRSQAGPGPPTGSPMNVLSLAIGQSPATKVPCPAPCEEHERRLGQRRRRQLAPRGRRDRVERAGHHEGRRCRWWPPGSVRPASWGHTVAAMEDLLGRLQQGATQRGVDLARLGLGVLPVGEREVLPALDGEVETVAELGSIRRVVGIVGLALSFDQVVVEGSEGIDHAAVVGGGDGRRHVRDGRCAVHRGEDRLDEVVAR